jgi:hypothetical protein
MITVINIIPQSLSGETNQDSEPNVAVNPANPKLIVASAFTPDPMGGPNAPIYLSTDGGASWSLNTIVPSSGSLGTSDITLRFAGTSNRLFSGILDGSTTAFEVHRTTDATSSAVMTTLETRANEDQPYVQAATVMGGADAGKDRVYIGVNDFNASGGKTATVEQTLDGGGAAPSFASVRVERRTTLGQNGPQVRPALHGDGTVYSAFYRWIASTGSFGANTLVISNAELILVRDDNWGTGATPFSALVDASDSLPGRRVATGLSFPFNQTGVNVNGQERWGGDISIAVDPRTSSTVYLAYSNLVSGAYTLNVIRSTDRGGTWSASPLFTVSNATNPALAINSLGKIALVYQQFTGTGATQRWETHYRETTNGTTWSDTTLCTTLSQAPTRTFSPYLGDYLHMMAVGKDFYGVFCASNVPDLANFPQGVVFQRNHDFAAKKLFALNGVTVVAPSIDPFFFKVTTIDGPSQSDYYLRDWTDSAAVHDTGLEPSTNPVFYATSDVWNQRSSAAPTFISDQPQNEDPQNDAGNFAFARISRNATGAAETVNVEFLVAEFGTGSPYASVATTTVAFAAADLTKIATAPWTLGPTTSTHLCLGAQISTPGDPFVAPGLNGNTPGWPTTDLMVINDNNKAQRNMSVHYGLSGVGSTHYAVVRNASTKARDFVLALRADPKVLRAFDKPTVEAQGDGQALPFAPQTTIVLKGMKAGESRWVAFGMASFKGTTGTALAVDFLEVVNEKIVNGCRFNIVPSSTPVALRELMRFAGAVMQRVGLQFKLDSATEVAKAARSLVDARSLTATAYFKFLAQTAPAMGKSIDAFMAVKSNDSGLQVAVSWQALEKATAAKSLGDAFASLTTLLNKLDLATTLVQKAKKG